MGGDKLYYPEDRKESKKEGGLRWVQIAIEGVKGEEW